MTFNNQELTSLARKVNHSDLHSSIGSLACDWLKGGGWKGWVERVEPKEVIYLALFMPEELQNVLYVGEWRGVLWALGGGYLGKGFWLVKFG